MGEDTQAGEGCGATSTKTTDDFRHGATCRSVDCSSVAQLRTIIAAAARAGHRVSARGNGACRARQVSDRDICLTMSGLNKIHEVDPVRQTIVLDCGVRLGAVSQALAAYGLSLPSLPPLPEATIGDAVATGAHGTNHRHGTLSDSVLAMDVMLASGELHRFDATGAAEELRAARVAVGMLGLIVRLQLQAVPMPWVKFSEIKLDLPSYLKIRKPFAEKFEHIWIRWTLGREELKIDCLKTAPKATPGFFPYVDGRNGRWAPPIPRRRAGWEKGWIGMRYGVKLSQIERATEHLCTSDFAQAHRGSEVSMNFLRGTDASYLGLNAGEDVVLFDIAWSAQRDMRAFAALMQRLDARPHWGGLHDTPDARYIRQVFPDFENFRTVQDKFDPAGMFNIIPKTEERSKARFF